MQYVEFLTLSFLFSLFLSQSPSSPLHRVVSAGRKDSFPINFFVYVLSNFLFLYLILSVSHGRTPIPTTFPIIHPLQAQHLASTRAPHLDLGDSTYHARLPNIHLCRRRNHSIEPNVENAAQESMHPKPRRPNPSSSSASPIAWHLGRR